MFKKALVILALSLIIVAAVYQLAGAIPYPCLQYQDDCRMFCRTAGYGLGRTRCTPGYDQCGGGRFCYCCECRCSQMGWISSVCCGETCISHWQCDL